MDMNAGKQEMTQQQTAFAHDTGNNNSLECGNFPFIGLNIYDIIR